MYKVTVYLKSGVSLDIICKGYKFKSSGLTGEYTEYEFTGAKKSFGFVLSEMAAYEVEKIEGEDE